MIPLLLALGFALDVQGPIDCPSPTEVSQRLVRLVPGREDAEPAPRALLSDGEGYVTIQLRDPKDGVLAERRLDRSGSCAEMAEAVAVILASWRASFDPKVAPMVIEPPRPAPMVIESPRPAPPPVAPSPPREPGRTVRFDVGMAALSSFVGSQAAFGGKLAGVVLPFPHGLGIDWSLSLSSDHTQDTTLPTVRAKWGRKALGVGPVLRMQGSTLALDLHGNVILAVLGIKGVGLATPASDTSVQLGVAGGLRGLWTGRQSAAWVGIDLQGFPGQDNLTVGQQVPVGRLPHLEFQLGVGIAFGRFR